MELRGRCRHDADRREPQRRRCRCAGWRVKRADVIYVGSSERPDKTAPDYVMTNVLVPRAADRTVLEGHGVLHRGQGAGSDPFVCRGFWELSPNGRTGACESVPARTRVAIRRPGPAVIPMRTRCTPCDNGGAPVPRDSGSGGGRRARVQARPCQAADRTEGHVVFSNGQSRTASPRGARLGKLTSAKTASANTWTAPTCSSPR